jgi:tetratricopeptide (TPR) repeat protein
VDRITRICSRSAALALLLAISPAAYAKDSDADVDLFWQAQRAELRSDTANAVKAYSRLLAKLPESDVAISRLLDAAVLDGEFASAVKAARAQQVTETGDAAIPLVLYVDAWQRKDWAAADDATRWLQQRSLFSFLVPILNAWVKVAQGNKPALSDAVLRENGMLAYYATDQLVYLDLANADVTSAKQRLRIFPGLGQDYARHMAMTAAEQLNNNGDRDFANALLEHIGVQAFTGKVVSQSFQPEHAIAALFSRLSAQLKEQGVNDQSLYFARLANWIGPQSAYGQMTLANSLADEGQLNQAIALLDSVNEIRPQWSWALANKAQILFRANRDAEALNLIQLARRKKPAAQDLALLEAQQLAAKGDVTAAVNIYRTLIADADSAGEKNGRRVTYRMLLAQILNAQKDWPSAKVALEQALAIDNQNPQLLNSLGYGLLERCEDVTRGIELVSLAHRLSPETPAITDSLGWGHYLNGDYVQAISLLEKAVEGAINDVPINEHLGDAYWQVGRFHEARYAWRAAVLQADGEDSKRIAAKIDLGWTQATAAP